MASGFFDSVLLSNHNHSSTPGDGGVLSNLSVTGTIAASGIITGAGLSSSSNVTITGTLTTTGIINEGASIPSATGDVVPFSFGLLYSLLTGT